MRRDLILFGVLVTGLIAWLGWQLHQPEPAPTTIGLGDVLGEAPASFARVTEPVELTFPADHAAHPDYRSEWWYFTGNFEDQRGQPLGFQFTLFRFGLGPTDSIDSDWQANHLWMAHLALSDGGNERFYQAERFARGALDLAGATAERWWLRDWSVERTVAGWQLQAATDDFAVELDLAQTRPLVLQGEDGYSRKGPEPGNASRYYSATRLSASGRVRLDERWREVEGLAWLDREWGSGQLSDSLAGWDWFALHLDDGRDLMIYRLRQPDGSASRYSAGVLVESDGHYQTLGAEDFSAQATRWWRDPYGVTWPLEWRLNLPQAGFDARIKPLFDDQLWRQSVRYWEGAVLVIDAATDLPVGRGYMELSGYAEGAVER